VSLISLALLSLSFPPAALSPDSDAARCLPSETLVPVATSATAAVRPVFAKGEQLQFAVSFGKVHVGSGEMSFSGRDTVRGRDVWKASLAISGGFFMLSVHDTSTSWFDSLTFNSLRFRQQLNEPHTHGLRDTQIFPDRAIYKKGSDAEHPSVSDPVDEISLVYYVRTLPLAPGQCYVFHRYFEPDGNPVVVHVLRRERVTVPAGTFDAIVLRPEIETKGIFSQNGRALLWLSDDSSHTVLQLKSQLSFGSINLYLKGGGSAAQPAGGGEGRHQ
jgi:hypothetical protein